MSLCSFLATYFLGYICSSWRQKLPLPQPSDFSLASLSFLVKLERPNPLSNQRTKIQLLQNTKVVSILHYTVSELPITPPSTFFARIMKAPPRQSLKLKTTVKLEPQDSSDKKPQEVQQIHPVPSMQASVVPSPPLANGNAVASSKIRAKRKTLARDEAPAKKLKQEQPNFS